MNHNKANLCSLSRIAMTAMHVLLPVIVVLQFSCLLARAQTLTPANTPALGSSRASLSGLVVNSLTGEPLSKAVVRLSPKAAGHDAYEAETDSAGRFTLKNIDSGQYTLAGFRQGYLQMRYGATHNFQEGIVLSFSTGPAPDVSLRLLPQSTISGRILDEDGDGLMGGQVVLLRKAYLKGSRRLIGIAGSATNDLGEFRFAGLGPGEYYLQATFSRRPLGLGPVRRENDTRPEGYFPMFYPGVADMPMATPVRVGPGQNFADLTMNLRRTRLYRVHGTVKPANPRILASGMHVMFTRSESGTANNLGLTIQQVPVRDDGTFQISDLAPGSYQLAAVNGQNGGGGLILGRTSISIVDSDLNTIAIPAGEAAIVHGQIIVEGQKSAGTKDIRVSLTPSEGAMMAIAAGNVKDDGSFVLENISREKFHVGLTGRPPGTYIKRIVWGERDTPTGTIDLTDTDRGTLRIILSSASAEVAGKVPKEGDETPAGITIVLAPDKQAEVNPDLFQTASLDQDGSFKISGVAPGQYFLYALEEVEPGGFMDPILLKKYENTAVHVKVDENDRQQVDLTIAKGAAPGEAN